jgi:transcriptional regulator with XRE-family HTH domain
MIDLRKLRKELNLTQRQAAQILGVETNTFARWERHELTPSRTAARLIEALGRQLSPEDLIRISMVSTPPEPKKKRKPKPSSRNILGADFGRSQKELKKLFGGLLDIKI